MLPLIYLPHLIRLTEAGYINHPMKYSVSRHAGKNCDSPTQPILNYFLSLKKSLDIEQYEK